MVSFFDERNFHQDMFDHAAGVMYRMIGFHLCMVRLQKRIYYLGRLSLPENGFSVVRRSDASPKWRTVTGVHNRVNVSFCFTPAIVQDAGMKTNRTIRPGLTWSVLNLSPHRHSFGNLLAPGHPAQAELFFRRLLLLERQVLQHNTLQRRIHCRNRQHTE